MNIQECLKQFRDDLIAWAVTNIDVKVPLSRKINGKDLTSDITLTAEDIGADVAGSAKAVRDEVIPIAEEDATNKAERALSEASKYTDTEIEKESLAREYAIETAKLISISRAEEETIERAEAALNTAKSLIAQKADINDKETLYDATWSSKKINGEIVSLSNKIGNLSNLKTSSKGTLVAAVNEVFQLGSNVKSAIVTALNEKGCDLNSNSSWDDICNSLTTIRPPDITVLSSDTKYGAGSSEWPAHVDTTQKQTLYGPINAENYSGAIITIKSCHISVNFNYSEGTIGVASGTCPDPLNYNFANRGDHTSYVAICRHRVHENDMIGDIGGTYWYPDVYNNKKSPTFPLSVTLNFKETSGDVYIYIGCVAAESGNGELGITVDPSIYLISRT